MALPGPFPLETCLHLGTVSPTVEEVAQLAGAHVSFYSVMPNIFSRRGGEERGLGASRCGNFYSILSYILQHIHHFPPRCANTSCFVYSDMTGELRHAAAGPRLRLHFLKWLFQFEEGRVAAGWRVINRAAIGGDQRHAGVLRVGFGICERVCGPIT